MRVDTNYNEDDRTLVIYVNGKFSFDVLREFRDAYEKPFGREISRVFVNLHNTDFIDSSALGMLLNMKEYLRAGEGDIAIINANQDIRKVLSIARFDKLFRIE